MKNPFTPTFGIVPPYLAGRNRVIDSIGAAYDNWPGDPNLSTILIGPRGCGKTAMLSCIGDEAKKRGWIVVDTSAANGMLDDILQRALDVSSEVLSRESGRHLTGFDIGSFLGLSWSVDSDTNKNWRSKMSDLLKKLGEKDIGMLITIDEVRADVDEMIEFAAVYQLLVREGAKIALVMAGLPVHVSDLISDKSVSFLRRARQQYLDNIPDVEIRSAFRKTVESAGKEIESDALDAAVQATGGFAYMMQLVGYHTWEASDENKTIVKDNVLSGTEAAGKEFESAVLSSTYRELSNGDVRFLTAMLDDEAESSISDIAKRLGKTAGYASTYKRRLMQAGIIEETGRAKVRFSIPKFREYMEKVR